MVQADKLDSASIMEVALPLLSQMIREGRSAEDPGHELKSSDRDK